MFFTYAGYIVVIANALLQEPVANFPGEDRGTFPFVIGDFVDHRGCRHSWLAAADRPWLDRAGLVIPAKEGERGVRYFRLTHVNVYVSTSLSNAVWLLKNIRDTLQERSHSSNESLTFRE